MKQIRIRSVTKDGKSSWVYIQEQVRQESTSKPVSLQIKTTSENQSRPQTNQYGRFRYNEMQYGEMERTNLSSIEISTNPIRIRNAEGQWVYTQQICIPGDCAAIRIRRKNGNQSGPWVYIQHEEV